MKRGAFAGAVASVALWARDLAGLRTLPFAGVVDAEAQRRVVDATRDALLGLELKLVVLHLVFGALFGALAARGLARRRPLLGGALAVLALHALATAGMMSRYPQLYADRLWLPGGVRATVMGAITEVPPLVFDLAFLALAVALAIGAFREWPRPRTLAIAGGAALAVLLVARGRSLPAPLPDAGPNILVLAVDSLRLDRVESKEVMPFVSSLAARGTLHRAIFTPLPRTFQSWVAALTGTEPRENGVRTMFPRRDQAEGAPASVFGALADAGYRTFVASDFAGDVFRRFASGFEEVDTPTLTADSLAAATVLGAHGFSLPALRVPWLRAALPEHLEIASLSDPEWLVDSTLRHLRGRDRRPFAGLVFFSTAHFPYVAPAPFYARGESGYTGRFRYHAPPATEGETSEADAAQVRNRYDGAVSAVDAALRRLWSELERSGLAARTIVVITADHGEELYERKDIAGHGDALSPTTLRVPLLVLGPGVPAGVLRDDQGRITDLPATLLDLAGLGDSFGGGVSLRRSDVERPLCVETGLWFWPSFPFGMQGERLEYEGIGSLIELDAPTRELVLRRDREALVESAKHRGVILGDRMRTEKPTPHGLVTGVETLPGVTPAHDDADLEALFDARCVAGDPNLERVLGVVSWKAAASAEGKDERACASCGLFR